MDTTNGQVETLLEDWNQGIEYALADGEAERAVTLAAIVLRHLPRHIATYQRLLQATWLLGRWQEGEDWAKRLLQADPSNVMAWRALARAAEQRDQRAQSHAMWQRAFEMSPYDPELRAGLARTSLHMPSALTLNLACLAALYMRGLRWHHAADVYRNLVRADARRIDFQLGLTLALWQSRATDDAYALARHLVGKHPHLLLGWVALDVLGDENDQALARNPIETMDPDGDFVRRVYGLQVDRSPVILPVTRAEAELLGVEIVEDEPDGQPSTPIEVETREMPGADVSETSHQELSDETSTDESTAEENGVSSAEDDGSKQDDEILGSAIDGV